MFRLQKWKLPITSFVISTLLILIFPLSLLQNQQIILNPDPALANAINSSDLEQTRQIINHRLNNLDLPGWPRATIKDGVIIVTVPKRVKQADIIDNLTGSTEIALIETGVEFPGIDPKRPVRTSATADPDRNIYQILLHPSDFTQAQSLISDREAYALEITLSSAGAARLGDFLDSRRGVYLCLTQNNFIIGCPIVKLSNDRHLEIRQGPIEFLIDEETLINYINTGTLPIPLVAKSLGG